MGTSEDDRSIATQRRSGGERSADEAASAELLRANRQMLLHTASDADLTNLKIDSDGTLIVHSTRPGYVQVFDFAARIEKELGAYVRVITDDAPVRRPGAMPL
jgi:hypothetical protein